MHQIEARNVNEALADGLELLNAFGVNEPSRNGPVLVMPEPVMTTYTLPTERVLFSQLRDANPFFHLMEALWMLAGRNDLEWPVYFNKNFASFSDDGKTVHGAYGHRWRYWFGYDQLPIIINELKNNPETRRCVLTMWDAQDRDLFRQKSSSDLHLAVGGGKDVPCNTQIYFDVREKKLNMCVFCRSNDIWWGCYGANAVHFSVLQEYMAFAIGVPVGVYRQFSYNYHLYPAAMPKDVQLDMLAEEVRSQNFYVVAEAATTLPLISTSVKAWEADLRHFMESPLRLQDYTDPFFSGVAVPMYRAWDERKSGLGTGQQFAFSIASSDWRLACASWIQRREAKKKENAVVTS